MKFPFETSFSSVVKAVVSAEKDRYLSVASLAEISKYLPNIDPNNQIDLLPIAFNAFVVNRGNKNGDIIDTKTALATYKNFVHKHINIEHDREKIVGVVLRAGITEFGTDKPLTEADVLDTLIPFNIVLGGVFWKIVDPKIASKIEESSDPQSPFFGSISASWELGFTNYKIAKINGDSKNLSDGCILDNIDAVASANRYIKGFGGKGTDGSFSYYRLPVGDVLPLGIGLVVVPAGDVVGVATHSTTASFIPFEKKDGKDGGGDEKNGKANAEKDGGKDNGKEEKTEGDNKSQDDESSECPSCKKKAPPFSKNEPADEHATCASCGKSSEVKNWKRMKASLKEVENISQTIKTNVIKNSSESIMKISKITDITDESMKQLTASAITDFIIEADKNFKSEKEKDSLAIANAENQVKELNTSLASVKSELEKVKLALEASSAKEKEQQMLASFNTRMASLDEGYNFNDEVRKAIFASVKASDTDEKFAAWKSSMSIFLKPFEKKPVTTVVTASATVVVENAMDAAEKQKNALANAAAATPKDKWADILKAGSFSVK